MKVGASRFAVVILSLVAILAGILGFSALQRPAQPGELAFDVENVDVGKVPLGQAVVQRFQVRNVGGAPVTITRALVAAVEGC